MCPKMDSNSVLFFVKIEKNQNHDFSYIFTTDLNFCTIVQAACTSVYSSSVHAKQAVNVKTQRTQVAENLKSRRHRSAFALFTIK